MNSKKAYELLEIDPSQIINVKYLKKQYHKQALLNHPDKNGNTEESKIKFQMLSEAYDYLKRETQYGNNHNYGCNEKQEQEDDTEEIGKGYPDILSLFLQGIFESDIFSDIVKEIVLKKLSVKLLESLDTETCLKVHAFLSKNKYTLHVGEDILNKINEIIQKKRNNEQEPNQDKMVFNLNPSMDDLFNNNVYKLIVEDQLYLVPLWHSELYFDGSGCEIVVLCEPQLESNCEIDENNNIYVKVEIGFKEIQDLLMLDGDKSCKTFMIGKKQFSIPLNDLYIKREQLYRMKKKGISKIKENNIYDIGDKADIIVRVLISI